MKELSIEEKARAYDEALEKAKEFKNNPFAGYDGTDLISSLFPELTESEDERIRKDLIQWINEFPDIIWRGHYKKDVIAWLEKQGKIVDYYEDRLDECACKYFNKGYKHALEKQGEQKSADKVEPKFKVGDWVVYNYPDTIYPVCKIIRVDKRVVDLVSENGSLFQNTLECLNVNYHLWAIQDAKDGDVLVASDGSIFLFKCTIDCACKHYVALTTDGVVKFNEGLEHFWETSTSVHPATKEQRDLLFQKIKESGYEWDAEKKELKKIHNAFEECEIVHVEHGKYYYCIKDYYAGGNKRVSKGDVVQALNGMNMMALGAKANEYFIPVNTIKQMSTWSEEDEDYYDAIIAKLEVTQEDALLTDNQMNFLKSLKDRVQPKQEWSEDDENRINRLIAYFEDKESFTAEDDVVYANWLKSLKDRYTWKPSDKQMEVLWKYSEQNNYDGFILTSLHEQLKKLREK